MDYYPRSTLLHDHMLQTESKSKEKKQVQSTQRKHLLDKVDKVRSHVTPQHFEYFSRIVTHLHVLKILNSLQIHSRHIKLKNQNLIHLSQMLLINRKLANFGGLGRYFIFSGLNSMIPKRLNFALKLTMMHDHRFLTKMHIFQQMRIPANQNQRN